ncbi:LptF/LptG family permease [Rhodohalobacter halophilus]|uniref:LptF/LptG family permease n=1 Tax=Rhodohalobacter halophilus TaxID=1812810 RepID=UPI00083F5CAF|nr:LptF/LptG family permease [Rhodohalobacter halophilus]
MFNSVQTELFRKHIGPFLFCFFTVMFLLLMQFLILHVDKLVGKGLPFFIVAELILTNLAYMVVLAVPMAVLVSTLIAYGKFSEWNELTAIRAAGINPIKLMYPMILTGFVLFGAMTYFSNYILPESNHKARSLFLDIRMQKPAFDLQPGTFYEDLDGYTFLITEIDSESDSLYDVRVFQDASDNRRRAYINAERGWLESADENTLSLYLYNGSTLRFIPGERRSEETMERNAFSRYRMSFDLTDLSFSRSNPDRRSRNDRTMSAQAMLAVVDTIRTEQRREIEKFKENTGQNQQKPFYSEPSRSVNLIRNDIQDTLNIYHSGLIALQHLPNPSTQIGAINRAINTIDRYNSELDNLKSNVTWRDFRVAEFLVEVHKKISIPFACVVFVFLGAPIGMLTRKGNLGVAALIGGGLLTIYFIAIIQGEKLADRMIISPFWGMWGINIFFLIVGIILTLHVSTSIRITNLFQKDE